MVEQPKVENKNESTDKKPRRWRRNKYSTSTHDTSGKEKFEGAADEMKGNVFSIGKHQADTYTSTMNALVIQVGTKYSAIVAAAIKELKVNSFQGNWILQESISGKCQFIGPKYTPYYQP